MRARRVGEGRRRPHGDAGGAGQRVRRSRPTWCCWRWASSARAGRLLEQAGVELDPRGNVAGQRRRTTRPACPRSSPPATCAAAKNHSEAVSVRRYASGPIPGGLGHSRRAPMRPGDRRRPDGHHDAPGLVLSSSFASEPIGDCGGKATSWAHMGFYGAEIERYQLHTSYIRLASVNSSTLPKQRGVCFDQESSGCHGCYGCLACHGTGPDAPVSGFLRRHRRRWELDVQQHRDHAVRSIGPDVSADRLGRGRHGRLRLRRPAGRARRRLSQQPGHDWQRQLQRLRRCDRTTVGHHGQPAVRLQRRRDDRSVYRRGRRHRLRRYLGATRRTTARSSPTRRIVGVGYNIDPKFRVNLDGRYYGTTNPIVGGTSFTNNNFSVMLGLQFKFGAPAAPRRRRRRRRAAAVVHGVLRLGPLEPVGSRR